MEQNYDTRAVGTAPVTSSRLTDVLRQRRLFPVFLDGHCSKRGSDKQQVKIVVVMLFTVCLCLCSMHLADRWVCIDVAG